MSDKSDLQLRSNRAGRFGSFYLTIKQCLYFCGQLHASKQTWREHFVVFWRVCTVLTWSIGCQTHSIPELNLEIHTHKFDFTSTKKCTQVATKSDLIFHICTCILINLNKKAYFLAAVHVFVEVHNQNARIMSPSFASHGISARVAPHVLPCRRHAAGRVDRSSKPRPP